MTKWKVSVVEYGVRWIHVTEKVQCLLPSICNMICRCPTISLFYYYYYYYYYYNNLSVLKFIICTFLHTLPNRTECTAPIGTSFLRLDGAAKKSALLTFFFFLRRQWFRVEGFGKIQWHCPGKKRFSRLTFPYRALVQEYTYNHTFLAGCMIYLLITAGSSCLKLSQLKTKITLSSAFQFIDIFYVKLQYSLLGNHIFITVPWKALWCQQVAAIFKCELIKREWSLWLTTGIHTSSER